MAQNLIDNNARIINERVEGFSQPAICETSTHRLYTAHITGLDTLEIHYSDDNGANWNLDKTFNIISGTISIGMFSFAVSDQDDIFLAYVLDEGSNYYTIKVKKRDYLTGDWSEILEETNIESVPIKTKPQLIWNRRADLTRLHLFWIDTSDGSSIDIYNKYTDNYGNSWTNGGSYPYNTSTVNVLASIDSNLNTGDIYILCYNSSSLGILKEGIFNSTGTETTFSNAGGVGNVDDKGASLAIDSSGNRWIVQYYIDDSTRYLKVWKNNVQSVELMSSSGSDLILDGMTVLGIDASDNIFAFYTKEIDKKAYYRKHAQETSTWGSEIALTTGDGLRINCQKHSLIGSNKLHTVFYAD